MRRTSALSLLLTLLAVAAPALAAPLEWSVDWEERLLADDNGLKLSPRDVQRLEDDPAFQPDADGPGVTRLEHRLGVELAGRLRAKTGVMAALQKAAGGKAGQGRWALGWNGKWSSAFGLDGGANTSHRVGLSWRPRAGWSADLSWRFLDNFDLRTFTDRDTGRERGATFDSDLYSLALQARGGDLGGWFRQPTAKATASWGSEYYNRWFTEYDMESWSAGLDLSWRLPAGFSAGLGYEFSSADNVGFTGISAGEVNLGVDSESGDATHQEDQLSANLGWSGRLGGGKGPHAGLDAGLTVRDRWYQTELGELLDPFHAGRHDQRRLFRLQGRLDLTDQLRLIPLLEYEWRDSEAAWDGIGAVKDFAARRAGLGLRWSLASD
jgi:hypothetical protein